MDFWYSYVPLCFGWFLCQIVLKSRVICLLSLYKTDLRVSEYQLRINYVQEKDEGVYECQISTNPISTFYVRLKVRPGGKRNKYITNTLFSYLRFRNVEVCSGYFEIWLLQLRYFTTILNKVERFLKKMAWIWSHHLHLQWKFRLLAGKVYMR